MRGKNGGREGGEEDLGTPAARTKAFLTLDIAMRREGDGGGGGGERRRRSGSSSRGGVEMRSKSAKP